MYVASIHSPHLFVCSLQAAPTAYTAAPVNPGGTSLSAQTRAYFILLGDQEFSQLIHANLLTGLVAGLGF